MQADFSKLFAAQQRAAQKRKLDAPGSSAPQTDVPSAKSGKKRRKRGKQAAGGSGAHAQRTSQPQPQPASASASSSNLDRRMSQQLAGARFRFINEQLYTRHSADAVALFAREPQLYEAYHDGFRSQSARWPQNPVAVIARWLKSKPATWEIADLGCGDAQLAARAAQKVHSFDLVAANSRVTACDIANVPLDSSSIDAAVFCLALMGTNFVDFLREAHRMLRPGGVLKVAEVSSRFDDIEAWLALLHSLGFELTERDETNTHFILFEFVKSARRPASKLDSVGLKPCIYKRR